MLNASFCKVCVRVLPVYAILNASETSRIMWQLLTLPLLLSSLLSLLRLLLLLWSCALADVNPWNVSLNQTQWTESKSPLAAHSIGLRPPDPPERQPSSGTPTTTSRPLLSFHCCSVCIQLLCHVLDVRNYYCVLISKLKATLITSAWPSPDSESPIGSVE